MNIFDLINKIPTLNEISGSFGEWLAKVYAKTMPGVLVLHDILIDGKDGYTSQIDLILIDDKGIYVIEIKMFDEAEIYGNIRNSHWTYYKHGKKYEIYSPLKQNEKHVDYLKSFLQDFGDIPYFSIITMICNDFKISGESIENTVICNSLPAMQRAMCKVSENRPIVFDDSKKQILYDYIKSNQHTGKEARQAHKNNLISYKESLDEMKNNKICPYCKTDLVLREGKYGKFFGCSNYPKCKFTMKFDA